VIVPLIPIFLLNVPVSVTFRPQHLLSLKGFRPMNAKVYVLTVILGFVGVTSALRGQDTTPAGKNDLALLQGRWTARAGARREVKVSLDIKGRKATATIKTPHGAKLLLTGEVKLDETTSPRRLDWINFTGADQQEFPPLLGIYSLKGDRFTVCNGGLKGARPREFKPGDGILAEVVVFEREPAVADAKSKPSDKSSATVKK
jgi:uncharacterized protein (TIGR03067 family)